MATILAWGYHDTQSPRHSSVCEDLRRDRGVSVVECHTSAKGFFGKCRDLTQKYRRIGENVDAVLVTFPGHFLVPLAWMLTRFPRKRLLFDAFISLYDTDVSDRRRFPPWHPWAWILWLMDWLSMHLADEVFIDTEAHRTFLIYTFHLKPERVRVIYLEARKDLFISKKTTDNRQQTTAFEVFFYGTLIPLQGVDVILQSARLLADRNANVHFTFVGPDALRKVLEREHLSNITFHPFVKLHELPAFFHRADVSLGIFGTTGKAERVIPHKVVDAVACGVPVITANTPAIREKFSNHPLVRLVPAGNSQALADAILAIRYPCPSGRRAPSAIQ